MPKKTELATVHRALAPFELPESAEELWVEYLRTKTERTRANYSRDLRDFAAWCEAPSIPAAIERLLKSSGPQAHKAILAYRADLQARVRTVGKGENAVEKRYSPATVARRINALRSVIALGRTYGLITWKIELKLPQAQPLRPTRGPGPEGYASVLAAIDRTESETDDDGLILLARRDRVMLRLLHDSMLRRFELVAIEWPLGVRMDPEAPEVLIAGKGRRGVRQWVPLSTPARDAVELYLERRGRRRGYLLIGSNHRGSKGARPIALTTVNARMKKWSQVAGVAFTPHGLRHTAITSAIDAADGNLHAVTKLSRHATIHGLRPYDDARRDDARVLSERISDPSSAPAHE